MSLWGLPTSLVVAGQEYLINSDFRDVLEIIDVLQDRNKHESIRVIVSLSLFYDKFEDIPSEHHQEAVDAMLEFINCGEPNDGKPQPKTIDWHQDRNIIAAEINKVAGTEVRALSYLHWWTFVSYFNSIGEGQLSFIVSIREKLRKGKKLESYENEFYRANRAKVDFKQELTHEEQKILNEWIN